MPYFLIIFLSLLYGNLSYGSPLFYEWSCDIYTGNGYHQIATEEEPLNAGVEYSIAHDLLPIQVLDTNLMQKENLLVKEATYTVTSLTPIESRQGVCSEEDFLEQSTVLDYHYFAGSIKIKTKEPSFSVLSDDQVKLVDSVDLWATCISSYEQECRRP